MQRYDRGKTVYFSSMSNQTTGSAECVVYDAFGSSRTVTMDGTFDQLDDVIAISPVHGAFQMPLNGRDTQLPKGVPTLVADDRQTIWYWDAVYYTLSMTGKVSRLNNNGKLYVYLHFEDGHDETLALGNDSQDVTISESHDNVVSLEILAETSRNIKKQNITVNGTKITVSANSPFPITLTGDTTLAITEFQFG